MAAATAAAQHAPGSATVSEEVYELPAGPVPRALLAACRPGPPLKPVEERDGWALFRLTDPADAGGSTTVQVAIRTSDHADFDDEDAMVAEFLRRARMNPRVMGEMQALLTLALHRDGKDGQWSWGDVARAVYGRYAKSHHIDLIRLAGALLQRAQWPTFDDGSPRGPRASPWGGSPLLRIDEQGDDCTATDPRRCRCPLTARLNHSFAQALRQLRHRVPPAHLRLPQPGHTNPKGRRLSRAALLRVRSGALHYWHGAEPDPIPRDNAATKVCSVGLGDLLTSSGIDVNALRKRRHLGEVLADVTGALQATAAAVGVGLARLPLRARRLLGTVLQLTGPQPSPAARNGQAQRPVSATPAPPANGSAHPTASRAPPAPQ